MRTSARCWRISAESCYDPHAPLLGAAGHGGPPVTTLVVVRKAGQVVMAADTLVTFGDTRLSHRFEANSKIFEVATPHGSSYIGMAGTVAHFPVLRKAMVTLPMEDIRLNNREAVFDTFLKLHPLLKETFFLQSKEDDNDPYESSQFTVLIANATGIYGLYSYREVFEFKDFWAVGSGRSFALGAMHAIWSKAKTAREVATAGLSAGCEFDKNSGGPIDLFTLKLKASS